MLEDYLPVEMFRLSGDMLIFRGVILSWFRSDKLNKWTPKNEFRFEMYHCSSKQITNKTHLTHLCQVCNLFYLGFRTCFKINLDSWCARIIMNHMGFWEEQCHSGKVFEQILLEPQQDPGKHTRKMHPQTSKWYRNSLGCLRFLFQGVWLDCFYIT